MEGYCKICGQTIKSNNLNEHLEHIKNCIKNTKTKTNEEEISDEELEKINEKQKQKT